MKNIYSIISLFVLALFFSCSSDDNKIDLEGLGSPTNISALTTVTQDNTGKVTFVPKGEGVTQYKIDFGDGTVSDYAGAGSTISHVYKEGVYKSKIIAMGLNGNTTELEKDVVVSFRAPENLVVEVTNDLVISKKVTVKATADFALFYDVYFGETGKPDPVSANNGESISYTYQEAGNYTIRVVSKSAAVKTTEKSIEISAKLVLNPTSSAPTQPNRQAGDVISIYSAKYTDLTGTNFYPNWGQSTTLKDFEIAGDKILNYNNLNYQGIELSSPVDVSGMEYVHMDIWTADLDKIAIFLISKSNGEKPVSKNLTPNEWTSIDIPISAFTSQNLTVADIYQFKFDSAPTPGKNIYIDNIYFYKAAGEAVKLPLDFESPTLTYTWGGFGNVDASIIANPNKAGINVSDKVLKLDKKSLAEVWGGASLNLENTLDYTKGTTVKINVWSPRAGVNILYKMELSTSPKDGNGNPTVAIEVSAKTTVSNAWQTLTYDLTTAPSFSTSIKYDRVILFPDFGVTGAGEAFYFDDIKQSN